MVEVFILENDDGSFSEMTIVCEHCHAMENVLTDLLGSKVSRVIMGRVTNELHGERGPSTATALSPEHVEVVAISRAPKRYLVQA
ncbi:MAG: hypothetical protein WB661_11190 [Candidatus Bathyarchaeia archaeon]